MKVESIKCPDCNNYLGDIHTGSVFCRKCRLHIYIKMGKIIKRVHSVLFSGTYLKDVT